MAAYYNEFEPYAADWLRNLISQGLIADGEVDSRSIVDVRADDLRGFTQCHFFAGIGVWSYAFRLAGWPDDRPVWTGSCPCQPFSAAGKGKGFEDERHLWPVFHRLINECRPPVVFGEQVASKDGLQWLDAVCADMEASGYAIGAADLCAAGVGAPHIRQRLWFVGERLDDTAGTRHLGALAGAEGEARDEARLRLLSEGRGIDGLADAEGGGGRAGLRDSGSGEQRRHIASDSIGAGGLGHADGARSAARIPEPLEREEGHAALADHGGDRLLGPGTGQPEPGRMADAGYNDGAAWASRRQQQPEPSIIQVGGSFSEDRRPGPTNGHWRNADWLHCRDGKWRPVEPGTFPLAHGAPARVGRLRAYGNAIVPQVAAEVISAFMEARGEI